MVVVWFPSQGRTSATSGTLRWSSWPRSRQNAKCVSAGSRNLQKPLKYTAKKQRVGQELKKRSFIQKYMGHVVTGLQEILKFDKADEEELLKQLEVVLETKRGQLEDMEFDPTKNTEYDEEWAKIGKEEESDEEDKE